MAHIVTVAIMLTLFTVLLLLFGFSKIDQRIGVWIIVIFMLSFILMGATTSSANQKGPRTHPTYTLARYVGQ
ncbi:MAG: hypothetical protein ACXADH_16110 [Candidatus Kariarchaeaceae archaeon]